MFKEINLEQNINKTVEELNDRIIKAAKLCISRGKTHKYKPFWNKHLTERKLKWDKAREKAERTKNELDVIEWRKASAQLKQDIKVAKRNSFDKYISELDYRTNSSKVHKHIKQISNNNDNHQDQPIKKMNGWGYSQMDRW